MVISFHLVRVRPSAILATAARTRTQRRALSRVPGLRFARTLGTGSGATMTAGADLARWATLAIWDTDEAYQAFLQSSLAPERQRGVTEWWRGEFDCISAHGAWGKANPFAQCSNVSDAGGPIAVLTRATIPLRHWRAFRRAVPPVDADLHRQPGLLATVGIGERPIGLQATFSLWSSASAVQAFAYQGPHAEVISAQNTYAWFSESLFARLAPRASMGTWDGVDPLATLRSSPSGHSIP